MNFLFTYDLSAVDTFTGDESLTDLVTEGMEPTVFALYHAMVQG